MRKFIIAIATIIFIDLTLSNCANPTPPTGGTKDTIPPTLLLSNPLDQTLNFKGQTITLSFDEAVTAEKIKQNLIITPTTDVQYKVLPKKETITIQFEQPFEDSTTYTLNFFAGITDITEKNPAENLIIAFSTTNYIDSLQIVGQISHLLTGEPQDKMTVGLYRLRDSLDLFSMKPTYFITTNETGGFMLQNIKENPYILLAFQDENKNLLFDAATETYAFYGDTLHLSQSITDSLRLYSLNINASPLKLISARPAGRYFEVRYSKPIIDYKISFPEQEIGPASDFTGEAESIRFYNNLDLQETDSIKTFLTVFDSLDNNLTDTVFVRFRSSSRKPATYSSTLSPSSGTWTEQTQFNIKFSKPTQLISDSLSLHIPLDTLFNIQIDAIKPGFNFNHTKYSFELPAQLKRTFLDTLESLINEYEPTDTLNIDTARYLTFRQLGRLKTDGFVLQIKPNSFVSVEQDTAKNISGTYRFSDPENFGTVKIDLSTEAPSYTVQLMANKKMVKQIRNCTSCTFNQVAPGKYWVRVLIDENNDGTWSPGNINEFMSPEPVIHFKKESELRANWQIELSYSF